jgi:hypothetical protein
MTRRNLHIPDEMWDDAKEAADHETRSGTRLVTVSEWIRRAIASKLSAHEAIKSALEAVRGN